MKKRSIEVRRKIACAENGHPRIATGCFGYVYCARCDEQIGDTLGSTFDAKHQQESAGAAASAIYALRKELTDWYYGKGGR